MGNASSQQAIYLPFIDAGAHLKMGLKALSLDQWLDIDEKFEAYLQRKAQLLAQRYSDVFAALPETQAVQQEALQLLTHHLVTYFPEMYQATDAYIENRKTHEVWEFQAFADAPLDLAARLIQEDLCLLLPDERGYILSAASVCFPLRWKLREKLGQPMSQIHQRVPAYPQTLARPVDNIFDRLREGFPGLRFNWSIVDVPDLFLDQDKLLTQFNPAITAQNAGQTLWLRVERQTLRRLPVSEGVLFTIRTYLYPLEQVTAPPQVAAQLQQAVQSLAPDMQRYKNLEPFQEALLSYLALKYQPSAIC
ncbi:MAG: DUF3445 domain-containing protein [Leptolyngbya sp. SIO1D8]|nr:DUF3445 domain-containing protein [Leptolyngbya sp. SIO1D8]